jgi:Holliday junction resolvase
MPSARATETSDESALYPLVQGYFEKRYQKQCWSERGLRSIQRRGEQGRYLPEGFPIPDLVAADSAETIAFEIKRDTSGD